jgi:NifB/MoaA-like Fe-S oxidoreductase
VRDADGAPAVGLVTGEYGARVLGPLLPTLASVAGVPVRLVPVTNRYFGGNIAVTGLLTAADVGRALASEPPDHRYLLPDVVLSDDRFLDGGRVDDLPRRVEVVRTDGAALVDALRGIAA